MAGLISLGYDFGASPASAYVAEKNQQQVIPAVNEEVITWRFTTLV